MHGITKMYGIRSMDIDEVQSSCPVDTDNVISSPVLTCSPNGTLPFLHSGYVARILSLEEEQPFENGKWNFFGVIFPDMPLMSSSDKFFRYFRETVFELMNLPSSGVSGMNENSIIQSLRKDISRASYFCNVSVSRCKSVEASKEMEDVANKLNSLCLKIGPVSELVNMYSLRMICDNVAVHAVFHAHLELSLHYLMLLSQLVLKYPGNSYQGKFAEFSCMVVSNVISISNRVYERFHSSGAALWEKEFFICSCMKEVWIVLIHCVDTISKMSSMLSFWYLVSTALQQDDTSQGTNVQQSKYSAEFKVWLLCHIAPLYWIDVSGQNTFREKSSVPRNWQVVQETVQNGLSSSASDSTLKSIVWACMCLTKHWDVQMNVFGLLWNYISKNTVTAHTSSCTLNAYIKKVYDLNEKFDLCLSYTRGVSTMPKKGDVFDLFLHYVVGTTTRIKTKGESQLMSQLKVKLYSKFHKHSMNEMSISELEKCFNLFTVLGLTCGTVDITKKVCSLISFLEFKEKTIEVRKLLVESVFITLMVCKETALPADTIVQKAVSLFTSIVSLLIETKQKKELFLQNWDILCYYFDCVEKCFDYNAVIPDEISLICPIYLRLLKISSDKQKKVIYAHFRNILSSSYLQLQDNTYDLVWKNIYIPLSETVLTESNFASMAELLGAITILSLERSENISNFVSLTNKYGFSEGNPIAFKCLYISHVLSTASSLNKLIELEKSNDIVKLWINSAVQELHKSPSVLELTRTVISSRQLLKWQPINGVCYHVEEVEAVFVQYIVHLGKRYASIQDWNEMTELRKTINFCFSDFIKISEGVVLTSTCQKSLTFVFKVAAQLVVSCGKVIYSKMAVCLLPDILDLFVLPMASAKKPTSSIVNNTIKVHLHTFLSGILNLYSKTDVFLTRKVKEITLKYFLDFIIKSSPENKRNPFLMSLDDSCINDPTKAASEYRHLVLECINERFLNLPQPPEQLVGVLKFLLKLIENTRCEAEHLHTMKLLSMKVVSCVLVCDAVRGKGEPRHVRKFAVDILRKITDHTKNNVSARESLRGLLRKFISDNLSHYQGIILKTMQCVCVVCPYIIKSLLSDIELLISEQEKRRGVGLDGTLRESFGQLQAFINSMTS